MNGALVLAWAAWALAHLCLLGGLFFMLLGAWGVVRLPDVYCRAHALGKSMTMGICLLLLGYWLGADTPGAGLKVFLAMVLQLVTIPVASHLLTLVALEKGAPRWGKGGWVR